MNTRDLLMRAVCEDPLDDTRRLAFADFLDEEAGRETDRAKLIRLQIELTNAPVCKAPSYQEVYTDEFHGSPVDRVYLGRCGRCRACADRTRLELKERDLLHAVAPAVVADMKPEGAKVFGPYAGGEYDYGWVEWDPQNRSLGRTAVRIERGFPFSLRIWWKGWLRSATRLHWEPSRPCPECNGTGLSCAPQGDVARKWPCDGCQMSGRLPSPFVPTAQPLTKIVLTKMPEHFHQKEPGVWHDDPNVPFGQPSLVPELLKMRWPGLEFELPRLYGGTEIASEEALDEPEAID